MILETYKLSLSELKLTCSTTVYKNLSLIMRIENRVYNIVNSTGLFDGQVLIKGKPIDTVAFQLDTQRKKYLPKQIEFQLNLTYRTGKLNQKLYSINFNDFVMRKKGYYEKQIKITQRLYFFYVVIAARSTSLDTIIQNPNIGSLTRIRSEKRFDRHGSVIPQSETKKRFSKYHSPQQQTIIKYVSFLIQQKTINQNIKITRPQQMISTPINQAALLNEQRQTSILREKFQQKQSELSEMEQQKTRDQSSFVTRNRVFTSRGRQPIIQRMDQYPTKGIITAVNNVGEKQKMSLLQQKALQLEQKLQQQQKRNYKLQKQLSGVKNKIQHLYHEKSILMTEKQEERLVFETRDKEEKMRQRRDIEQLRRVYEGQLRQKDERILKMQRELVEMKVIQSKKFQETIKELEQRYRLKQRESNEMSEQISLLGNRIGQLQSQLSRVRQQLSNRQEQPKLLTTPHHFIIRRNFLDEEEGESSQQLNYTQTSVYSQVRSTSYKNSKQIDNSKQVRQNNNSKQEQQKQLDENDGHNNSNEFIRQQQLLQLMQQQTLTYNMMIVKLQDNLSSLQKQYKQQTQKNNYLMEEIKQLQYQFIKQKSNQFQQQRSINQLKTLHQQHQQQIHQYQQQIHQLNSQLHKLSSNQSNINHSINSQCHHYCISNETQYTNHKHINEHNTNFNSQSQNHNQQILSNIQQLYYHQPQTIKITTKQNTNYKITLYPSIQLVYIPPSQFQKQYSNITTKFGQSTGSEGYGKNYQLYQKNRQHNLQGNQQSYKTTGYFGTPLHKLNHNNNSIIMTKPQQSTIQQQQQQNQNNQLINNLSCQNNYSYISKKQLLQQQQQQYLNLINQFQVTEDKQVNINKNYKNTNILNKNNKNQLNNNNKNQLNKNNQYQLNNNNQYQLNNNNKNQLNKKRSHSFYISSDILDNNSDSIIINKEENSYIDENGDYVKKSLLEVYQRNRINSIG